MLENILGKNEEHKNDFTKAVEQSNIEYLDWAKERIKKGYSKDCCKKSLLLMVDVENAKISYNTEYLTAMAPIMGYAAVLSIFALGLMTTHTSSHNFILFILYAIIGLLICIFIAALWSLSKDKKKRIEIAKKLFLLKEAADYIEKNIKD